jgi:large subunit ribosomal protein L25
MQDFTILVEARSESGSSGSRRCRAAGFLPAIAYHCGESSKQIKVPYKEFVRLAERARKAQVFIFKSDSSDLDGKPAIVKSIQRDYVANKLLHVDFQTLKDNEEINIGIPVKIVGEAPGVKVDGGVLTIVTHEIQVKCLPKNIPVEIPVDVSKLQLNQSIHVRDLVLREGVTILDDLDDTVVSVAVPRAAVEETAAAAAATPAAGAAAPAAEGDAAKKAEAAPAKK